MVTIPAPWRDTPGPTWQLVAAMLRNQRRRFEDKPPESRPQQKSASNGAFRRCAPVTTPCNSGLALALPRPIQPARHPRRKCHHHLGQRLQRHSAPLHRCRQNLVCPQSPQFRIPRLPLHPRLQRYQSLHSQQRRQGKIQTLPHRRRRPSLDAPLHQPRRLPRRPEILGSPTRYNFLAIPLGR